MLLRNLHVLCNCNLLPFRLFISAVEVIKTPKPKANDVEKGKAKIENGTTLFADKKTAHTAESESWPHKHRPQSIDEIIGNQSIVIPFLNSIS